MSLLLSITLVEIIYLIYMFFIFKTTYSFQGAKYEKQMNALAPFFKHYRDHHNYDDHDNVPENKICGLGKAVAIIGIFLALLRLIYNKSNTFRFNLIFLLLCLFFALLLNYNAAVYIIPILLLEIYIMFLM